VKVHVAVSSEGLPLSIVTGPGNEHDSQQFEPVMADIRINIGRGRPRTRPVEVVADAGYDSDSIRAYLRRRGIKSNIPANKRNQKKPSPGRPTRFDEATYKNRGVVERFFGWLKLGFRRIATRHERIDACFQGFLQLAAFLMIWRRI